MLLWLGLLMEEKLSSTERGLFERARKILVGEISTACHIEKNKAKYIIKEAVSKGDRSRQIKSHWKKSNY